MAILARPIPLMNSRALTIVLLGMILTVSAGPAFAQVGTSTSAGRAQISCERLTQFADQVMTRLAEHEQKYGERYTERLSKINGREVEQDARLVNRRGEQTEQRSEWYTKLEVKATTDAQKAAVAIFRSTIDVAITTRRAAVDKAVADFRIGLDAVIAARKATLDGIAATFTTSMNTALAKAKTDCAAQVDPRTVRETLRVALEAARVKFQTDKTAAEKARTTIEALRVTRRTAIKNALDAFRATAEQARAQLKAAFPRPTSTTP